MEKAGAEDEVGVLLEGHAGVLGAGIGGELRAAPAQGAVGGAFEELGHEWLAGGLLTSDLGGVDAAEIGGVLFRPERDLNIGGFDAVEFEGREVGELVLGAVGEEEFVEAFGLGDPDGVAAGLDDGFEGGFDEGEGVVVGADGDEVALFDAGGVADKDIGEFVEARVEHGGG